MHIYTWAIWMHAVRCDLHGSAAPLDLSYGAALRPAAVNEVLNSEEAGSRSSLLLMLETSIACTLTGPCVIMRLPE